MSWVWISCGQLGFWVQRLASSALGDGQNSHRWRIEFVASICPSAVTVKVALRAGKSIHLLRAILFTPGSF
jgi:hypothetical protein